MCLLERNLYFEVDHSVPVVVTALRPPHREPAAEVHRRRQLSRPRQTPGECHAQGHRPAFGGEIDGSGEGRLFSSAAAALGGDGEAGGVPAGDVLLPVEAPRQEVELGAAGVGRCGHFVRHVKEVAVNVEDDLG